MNWFKISNKLMKYQKILMIHFLIKIISKIIMSLILIILKTNLMCRSSKILINKFKNKKKIMIKKLIIFNKKINKMNISILKMIKIKIISNSLLKNNLKSLNLIMIILFKKIVLIIVFKKKVNKTNLFKMMSILKI